MKKEVSQMAFREFLQRAKEESSDLHVIENVEREILDTMQKEGFADEQIYEMKMERLWKLWIDSYSLLLEQCLTQICAILKKNPNREHVLAPLLKNLEDSIRELEEEEKRKKE